MTSADSTLEKPQSCSNWKDLKSQIHCGPILSHPGRPNTIITHIVHNNKLTVSSVKNGKDTCYLRYIMQVQWYIDNGQLFPVHSGSTGLVCDGY